MLTREAYVLAQGKAVDMMVEAGIAITDKERGEVSVADFGLNRLELEGGQILTFFNTDRISTKVIAMFPNQTLPEHRHPEVGDDPGKQEIIRVIKGILYFYLPGEDTIKEGTIPEGKKNCYRARNERVMMPGDQVIIPPGTWHWFQADQRGAVVYSFSTCVRDLMDEFTDPKISRETKIVE